MRVFLAIDVDNKIRNQIKEAIKQFPKEDFDIKFVEPENLHFTVKFLGEVYEDKLPEVQKLVSEAVKDFRSFRISLGNMGYFGNPSYVKVLWIDMKEGCETILELMKQMNKKLGHIRREDFKSTPHLTIGRVKSGRNKDKLLHKIDEMSHMKFGEFDVKFVELKSSQLTKQGPLYRTLEQFPLG